MIGSEQRVPKRRALAKNCLKGKCQRETLSERKEWYNYNRHIQIQTLEGKKEILKGWPSGF